MVELENKFKKNGGDFKEFKIEKLFEVKSNPQLNKESFCFSDNGKYPYFTRTVSNNGILGYVGYLDEEHKIKGNSIAVGMLGMQFFYMEKDFYAGQFTKTIFPKFSGFNEKLALYFIGMFNKQSKLLSSVLVRDFEKTFVNSNIILPVKDDHIDFQYIQDYISVLEEERISVLESYLKAAGLDSFVLTPEEEDAYNRFKRGNIQFQEFQVDKIFVQKRGKEAAPKRVVSGGNIPVINEIQDNNGVYKYGVGTQVMNGNAITVSVNFASNVFYQEVPFYASVNILVLYSSVLSENNGKYFVASIRKANAKYDYSHKISKDRLNATKIWLPVTPNKEIDLEFMEIYIRAIEKKVIRHVVEWKDEVIAKTKEVMCV